MRTYQYVPAMHSAGIDITVEPLFSDDYVRDIQNSRRRMETLAAAFVRRLQSLRRARSFDLLWIEKELFPWFPSWTELPFLRRIPYVLDYDDAVFHYYDQHRNAATRWFLADKHRELIGSAAMVLCGNEYLARYAREAGGSRVHIVPTAIDLERYPPPSLKSPEIPYIGWIGQRSTADFLTPLAPILHHIHQAGTARLCAIGADAAAMGLPMTYVPWSEETEVQSIHALDIGVMPLVDGPFERGKCGYKLIQYMACGLPVVASPVGVNQQLVEHGVNGFLATTEEEWRLALETLATDKNLRHRMGAAGRRLVEAKYSIQTTAPELVQLLRAVISK
jgi:glycosyltransferase involved in cell wall biosynthesis